MMVLEVNSPHDPNAISVGVSGHKAVYLSRSATFTRPAARMESTARQHRRWTGGVAATSAGVS
jgi:hypothetical protein